VVSVDAVQGSSSSLMKLLVREHEIALGSKDQELLPLGLYFALLCMQGVEAVQSHVNL